MSAAGWDRGRLDDGVEERRRGRTKSRASYGCWGHGSGVCVGVLQVPKSLLWRYRLDPVSGRHSKELLMDLYCDFPSVNPAVSSKVRERRHVACCLGLTLTLTYVRLLACLCAVWLWSWWHPSAVQVHLRGCRSA